MLDDPLTAFREIDRVLEAAVRYKRPVYLELPRDMISAPGRLGYQLTGRGRPVQEAEGGMAVQLGPRDGGWRQRTGLPGLGQRSGEMVAARVLRALRRPTSHTR